MTRYQIKYNTGAGDQWIDGDIKLAMQAADEGAAHTQQPIDILDEGGDKVISRYWYGVAYAPDDEDADPEDEIIQFGDFGYYGPWTEQ